MCDASENAACCVPLFEDYANKNTVAPKAYARDAFGARRLTTGQKSLTMYAKEFFAMHFAFDEFGHVLWGVKKPYYNHDGSQTSNSFILDQTDSSGIADSLWQGPSVQFHTLECLCINNPAADYLSRLDLAPTDRIRLKLTDSILIQHIEVDLASQTPKQNDNDEDYHPNALLSPDSAATPQPATEVVNALLMMVTPSDGKLKDNYEHILQLIRSHMTQDAEDASSDAAYHTRFALKRSLHHPAVNQISPLSDHEFLQAQLHDVNVQRMIRTFRDGDLPPSHPIIESQFFKKNMKNRSRLQVFNDNLYQEYFDNTGKATIKQIVVRDSIIDKIISTLHENPMKGHPGASKTLQVLRPRYYAKFDLTRKVQDYIDNCQMRIRGKPCSNTKLRPRLEQIYDPCDRAEDVMEINHVGELAASKT